MAYRHDISFAEKINQELIELRRKAGLPESECTAGFSSFQRAIWPQDAEGYVKAFMTSCVQRGGGGRDARWSNTDIFGYEPWDLLTHIEALFEPWMTWENRSPLWVIDHIRPIISFYITSIYSRKFRQANALENLRPLCRYANAFKGGGDSTSY